MDFVQIIFYISFMQRCSIVHGEYEPKDEECEWNLDSELSAEISKELEKKATVSDVSEKPAESQPPEEK